MGSSLLKARLCDYSRWSCSGQTGYTMSCFMVFLLPLVVPVAGKHTEGPAPVTIIICVQVAMVRLHRLTKAGAV